MKKLIILDVDGTVAKSKTAIDEEMAALLAILVRVVKVALISGGDWPQFKKQVISHLPDDMNVENLFILPTCGTKFYDYKTDWEKRYSEDFSKEEKEKIIDALHKAVEKSGLTFEKIRGEQIEDRGSQITFSALGQKAPLSVKKLWDPDFAKRERIKKILDPLIPGFSARLGGTTSIDITRKGIDKGYGIEKLHEVLNIDIDEMLFVGDALFPGGNDYPAEKAGVVSIPVKGPAEAKRVVEAVIACLSDEQLPAFNKSKEAEADLKNGTPSTPE